MGFRNPILGGGGALVRPAIKSPGYVAGSSGWSVNRDGSAEFNELVVRGEFKGTTYEVTTAGLFFYASTPGPGVKLVGSWSPAAGTDPYGNSYPAGLTVYDPSLLTFAQLYNGVLLLGALVSGAPDTTNAAGLNDPGAGQLKLQCSKESGTSFVDAVEFRLSAGQLAAATGSGFNPVARIVDSEQSSAVDLGLSGTLVHTSVDGTFTSWAAPTMQGGWASGPGISGSWPDLLYRQDTQNCVTVHGTFHATSTAPGTLLAAGLPLAPGTHTGGVAIGYAVKLTSSSVMLPVYLDSTGHLRINSLPTIAVNDTYGINVSYPMGQVS